MKVGETLIDDQGQTWTVEAALGRGVWARSWSVRSAQGLLGVLRRPLVASDFPESSSAEQLEAFAAEVCDAVRHTYASLAEDEPVHRRPIALVHAPEAGFNALVFARYAADLESRLQAGIGLSELIDLLTEVARRVGPIGTHGNLRPTNILVDPDRGVAVADLHPTGVDVAWRALQREMPGRVRYRSDDAGETPNPAWDAWALCQILHRATMLSPSSDDPRRGPAVEAPHTGLSRIALATLKDAAAARLRTEDANPRFASRATERLGGLLGRGLSAEHEPSPPFRFRTLAELHSRLHDVADLIHPAVVSVARPALAASAKEGVFEVGQAVEFAINVSTTAGVTATDDIATGVQLRDLDGPEHARVRVPNARFTVKQYPSGRWRFTFELPDVAPGRYHLRVAFMIKGNEGATVVTETSFQVRPTPGYVPPPAPHGADAPRNNAIPLPNQRARQPDALEAPPRPLAAPTVAVASAPTVVDRLRSSIGPTPAPRELTAPDEAPRAVGAKHASSDGPRAISPDEDDAAVIPFPRASPRGPVRPAGTPGPIRPAGQHADLDDVPDPTVPPAPLAFARPVRSPPAAESNWRSEPPTIASVAPPPAVAPIGPRAPSSPTMGAEEPSWRPWAPPPADEAPDPAPSYGTRAQSAADRAWAADPMQPAPPVMPAMRPPVVPDLPPLADPPSLATSALESLPVPAELGPGSLDYPRPDAGLHEDLPVYAPPASSGPPAWRVAIDKAVELLGGDPINAVFFGTLSMMVVMILIAASVRGC